MAQNPAQLYRESIIIDGCNPSNWDVPEVFRSLHNGGVTAGNATIAIWDNFTQAMDNIAAWEEHFHKFGVLITPIRTVADIHRAKKEGKAGIIFGWQNATPIENDLRRLALFHTLGVRIIQLTYNERNLVGNGCYERTDEGLSKFGQEVVQKMNRLGILIDLSHVGDRTTLESIELSMQPVAFTHAGARSHYNHPRNKTDEALRLMAERGGVVGANGFPMFLPSLEKSTLNDFLDSIDVLVEKVGINHVGLGIDYTQGQDLAFFELLFSLQGTRRVDPLPVPWPLYHPKGMETPDSMVNIAAGLSDRGYKSDDIKKVLGENWLRLFRQVWKE